MSTDRLMDKEVMIHIYTMEYYSAMKRNKFESVVVRQMNLELVIQSEREKPITYINTYIYGI